jgi:hypothetical protein
MPQLWISGAAWDVVGFNKSRGCPMSPVMRKAFDVLIAIALTAGVVFVIVVVNSFLMSRGGSWQGIRVWYAFIGRPDILGTMALTALVTMLYVWQQSGRPRL